MNKTIPKKVCVGYALWINRETTKGKWERVGFLFNNGREASEYRERFYGDTPRWSVNRVRISAPRVEKQTLYGHKEAA